MTRPMALPALALLFLAVAAPATQATKRTRLSHVPACAAMPKAPCQALIRNWRPDMTVLVARKEMMR